MYSIKKRKVITRIVVLVTIMGVVSIAIKHALVGLYTQIEKAQSFMSTQVVSCHRANDEKNSLPSAEDIIPPPDSIFFHETSCKRHLNSRQACSIESAARHHPNRHVYVFFNSPINDYEIKDTCLSTLLNYSNIFLARLHNDKYAKDTPLDEALMNTYNAWSAYPVAHTSDILRFVTLYKYGGVYLDTDMLIVKSLDSLGKNWAARQDPTTVNTAAMAIGRDGIGHTLAYSIVEDIENNFRGDEWSYNGPEALTRSLLNTCNTTNVRLMSATVCRGFEVYDSKMFYPFYYDNTSYFLTRSNDFSTSAVSYIFAYHLWNHITITSKVEMGSPYEQLARQHCPLIREQFGANFGADIEYWRRDEADFESLPIIEPDSPDYR